MSMFAIALAASRGLFAAWDFGGVGASESLIAFKIG
jgi:hypothetical protein